jgi:cell pole-organizing protein PopZ
MSHPGHLNQTEQACAELAASGQPVTFTARTGIGRATLYRNPAVRAVIEEHRHQAASASTLTAIAAEIAALRTALEAVAARVRHHEEQIRQLKRATTRRAPEKGL